MSEEAVDVLGIMAGVALILCSMILLLSPSPMQQCIKAGYEWRGGDCVMVVEHD
jgi:hypothetical protein